MQLKTIGLPIYDLLLFILPSFQLKGLCNNTCVLFKMRIWSKSLKEFRAGPSYDEQLGIRLVLTLCETKVDQTTVAPKAIILILK